MHVKTILFIRKKSKKLFYKRKWEEKHIMLDITEYLITRRRWCLCVLSRHVYPSMVFDRLSGSWEALHILIWSERGVLAHPLVGCVFSVANVSFLFPHWSDEGGILALQIRRNRHYPDPLRPGGEGIIIIGSPLRTSIYLQYLVGERLTILHSHDLLYFTME